jgi:predicted Zn-ribbon and HTH transcriptional regulator
MLRRDLIEVLLDRPTPVSLLARQLGLSSKELQEDLKHLFRSLEHTPYCPVVFPARCRKCGFEFSTSKTSKPSRCPQCRSQWLAEPRIMLRQREAPSQSEPS